MDTVHNQQCQLVMLVCIWRTCEVQWLANVDVPDVLER